MLTIYFGEGCFWCSEAVFTRLKGVESVTSGYAGGNIVNPSYQEVCTGTTGHAEVVKITYDKKVIPLKTLLDVFFSTHDPTTLNKQGYDHGTQYRSAIFYQDVSDKKVIEKYLGKLSKDQIFAKPVVTEVRQVIEFYPAELDHYRYYDLNQDSRYCQVVITPKLAKLRTSFAHLLK